MRTVISRIDNDGVVSDTKRSKRLQQGEEDAGLMKALWRAIQRKKSRRIKLEVPKALPSLDNIVAKEKPNLPR
ncbi:hypothetical protein [Vibrio alfacsensis]|uniref:hypothetical protein n=1 Tax=Vibrio alfacsensis TaxID=1074311 RepID=UPI00406901B2